MKQITHENLSQTFKNIPINAIVYVVPKNRELTGRLYISPNITFQLTINVKI